ncbi:tryptophan halogenase family protein [Sphingomonas sp. Leaf21]|uniref:tryptophan halogenase family protein n=1 Tax=Sphingomonas sp. Leaf21 TaxID=2876550 RepID=UPI001E3EDDD4|nr:tryptophan halogenase family protein [Sphingomonas sp. Leaf21]
MADKRSILVVGGGTAGWLTAAYLAKAFAGRADITLLESRGIGAIGVGEGAFPTIRQTLDYLGIDERRFIRSASATFKQGIRFDDWLHAPTAEGARHRYLHPFEPPFSPEQGNLVPYWLAQDAATRPPFAAAMTIQNSVAEGGRAPKQPGDRDYAGPLTYAYHFDAERLVELLAERGRELGVRHLEGLLTGVDRADGGGIDRVHTAEHGALTADLFVDCSGFRAELIGRTLGSEFRSVRDQLFTDRALACKIPYDAPDTPIDSFTVATAHEAGWIWDIGLQGARGIGCVFSSRHIDDDRAAAILRSYVGHDRYTARTISFEPGYRPAQWIGNCVAVGLSAGFLEPLESTGIVLIEAAAAMIAELSPPGTPVAAAAARFNRLMTARFDSIIAFLKLHYCLSRREERFWRENADPASVPEALRALLDQWRHRPPSRFDFLIDVESFAYFNYQYILYGMGYDTAPPLVGRDAAREAGRIFQRIRKFGERAISELPPNRIAIDQLG